MKTPADRWKSITRKYLGDTWVKNEMAVLDTITKQQLMPPISVAQAREQVQRLKQQSQSVEKKGQNLASK